MLSKADAHTVKCLGKRGSVAEKPVLQNLKTKRERTSLLPVFSPRYRCLLFLDKGINDNSVECLRLLHSWIVIYSTSNVTWAETL